MRLGNARGARTRTGDRRNASLPAQAWVSEVGTSGRARGACAPPAVRASRAPRVQMHDALRATRARTQRRLKRRRAPAAKTARARASSAGATKETGGQPATPEVHPSDAPSVARALPKGSPRVARAQRIWGRAGGGRAAPTRPEVGDCWPTSGPALGARPNWPMFDEPSCDAKHYRRTVLPAPSRGAHGDLPPAPSSSNQNHSRQQFCSANQAHAVARRKRGYLGAETSFLFEPRCGATWNKSPDNSFCATHKPPSAQVERDQGNNGARRASARGFKVFPPCLTTRGAGNKATPRKASRLGDLGANFPQI